MLLLCGVSGCFVFQFEAHVDWQLLMWMLLDLVLAIFANLVHLKGTDTGQAWLYDKPLENKQRYLTAVSSDLLSQYKGV